MKRFLSLCLIAGLLMTLPLFASARSRGNEPLHNVNLDRSGEVTFAHENYFKARWITVSATVNGPAEVRVMVLLDQNNKTVFDRTFGEVDGSFTSPEIYLEFQKSATVPYRVDLYVNGQLTREVLIHRMLLMLNGNNVVTRGIRFREYEQDLTDKWFMFTPIDFASISTNNGAQVIDLIGSNMYVVGKLTILRDGDRFMFTVQNIDEYNATHDLSERSFDPDWDSEAPVIEDHQIQMSGWKIAMYPSMASIDTVEYDQMPNQYGLDRWYSISGNLFSNTKQILYVNGRVSYDPNGLERIYDTIHSGNIQQLMSLLAQFPQVDPR